MNKAEFTFKRVYGRPKFYPSNELASKLTDLTERKCLGSLEMIKILKMKNFFTVEILEDDQKMSNQKLIEVLKI